TGRIEPGTVVTLALLLTRLYTPMTALANARVDVMTALVSFERVFEVLDLKPMITERPGAVALPDGPVDVELSGVRFAYPSADQVSLASLEEVATLDTRGGEEVLHGVDLEVGAGKMVALVGPSGAGKSTLASLVPRLYDVDAGSVRLAGIDVRDLTFASLRGAVGVVTQDGHLFHDTIRANLRYAAPEASDDELLDALRRARLGDLLASLPDGLDTVAAARRAQSGPLEVAAEQEPGQHDERDERGRRGDQPVPPDRVAVTEHQQGDQRGAGAQRGEH